MILNKLVKKQKGFTLIELMIVVTIVGILAAIAVPNYKWGIIRAKEAVLRENLYNMRNVLDQFFADQGKFPDSLDELVEKKYMKSIPNDPITGKPEWDVMPPPDLGQVVSEEKGLGNVYDVKSTSSLVGSNGIPYGQW
ncbi:type IV pilin protein [Geobacter sp. DSM 9736]|uniref:type IV pilin protein n=1 Tax=Geobacter sp. DSM 9736 TaxID=1277350 RepID=UPI000B50EBA9|nr:type II secretion system protein [Geobacter sp. DSM 9736]SNB45284.1 type II secretion system protein G (GspG) [Geobacter sp. DSM 9736]